MGLILYMIAFLRRRREPLTVPDYPLRCQHCTQPIRLLTAAHPSGPAYADETGKVLCEGLRLGHKPMPGVLG